MHLSLLLISILLSRPIFSDTFTLTEKNLIDLARKQNPTSLSIETSYLKSAEQLATFEENFNTNFKTSAKYNSSNEKATAVFIPVFSPSTELAVGVERGFSWGAGATFDIFSNQQSTRNLTLDRATRSGLRMGFSFDLWKNFLGRLNKAQLHSLQYQHEASKLQSEINQHVFELNLRKIYWALVANQESLQITKNLLNVAEKQHEEAKRRLKESVGDRGIVAKHAAHVASRRSQISALEYQKLLLHENLQAQLPDINSKLIELGTYDIQSKTAEVLLCTQMIKERADIPWEFTQYDEIVKLYQKAYQEKTTLTEAHSSMDLKFQSQIQVSGVDQGYGRSLTDLTDNGGVGYQVGLVLTIPLEGGFNHTETIQKKIDEKLFLAQQEQLNLKVASAHQQIGHIIEFLYKSLEELKTNTGSLEISLEETRRKYKQARADIFDLVQEQDAYQQSLLSELSTKLKAIEIIYDYFQIFPQFPCQTNLLGDAS